MPHFTNVLYCRPDEFTHLAKGGVVRAEDLLQEALQLLEGGHTEKSEDIFRVAVRVEQYQFAA